jgi:hypothetical protein
VPSNETDAALGVGEAGGEGSQEHAPRASKAAIVRRCPARGFFLFTTNGSAPRRSGKWGRLLLGASLSQATDAIQARKAIRTPLYHLARGTEILQFRYILRRTAA